MTSAQGQPFGVPPPDTVPGEEATLEEIGRFARAFDPTEHFAERWGDDYAAEARSLWRRCVEAHKAGEAATGPLDELMMCLTYDWVLGPHLGAPEPHKLGFLRWLLAAIRREVGEGNTSS